jgi:hypothetical protein
MVGWQIRRHLFAQSKQRANILQEKKKKKIISANNSKF